MTLRSSNLRLAVLGAAILVMPFVSKMAAAQGAPSSKTNTQSKAAASPTDTPHLADGHPDMNGVWVPAREGSGGSTSKKDANGNVDVRLFARDGSPTNFNVDNTIKRRADPNKPVYKPEFLQKTKDLDDNEASQDPLFFCKPAGVPRVGAPNQISQTRDRRCFCINRETRFA